MNAMMYIYALLDHTDKEALFVASPLSKISTVWDIMYVHSLKAYHTPYIHLIWCIEFGCQFLLFIQSKVYSVHSDIIQYSSYFYHTLKQLVTSE